MYFHDPFVVGYRPKASVALRIRSGCVNCWVPIDFHTLMFRTEQLLSKI